MKSNAGTAEEYIASLPPDRMAAINKVREVILKNLDSDFEEGMGYGMIVYQVPFRVHPAGYHCNPQLPLPYAGLASQKGYMVLHLMSLYMGGQEEGPAAKLTEWFRNAWAKSGKKLDMGKACIRFKKVDDLPLDVIAEAIRRVPAKKYIQQVEASLASRKPQPAAAKKPRAKKSAGA